MLNKSVRSFPIINFLTNGDVQVTARELYTLKQRRLEGELVPCADLGSTPSVEMPRKWAGFGYIRKNPRSWEVIGLSSRRALKKYQPSPGREGLHYSNMGTASSNHVFNLSLEI